MKRYVTMPVKADDEWWDRPNTESLAHIVYEPDPSPRETGLLDSSGNKIFSVDTMEPIGFVKLSERKL